ncbi:hypothetical protein EUX98_g4578 [Antrodiella citrinella]|uniref:Uncharacterized protein n=1 Tax=Antrodiella citrinella TaxID=2447956 RepID=A0A4S4MUI1_9APHY|nr:hypothetical protein EUX98_g4578 [Antrodiella citrinella]
MDVDERSHSRLSEFDTSSDSDWLDISSRASEDNDSVASFFDSDREDIDDRPASRRSLNSSRSGVVDGWEGLIDDVDEDATPAVDAPPTLFSDPEDNVRSASPNAEEDPEEERVKAGLEQSMMSTLSSSRSNSLANSMQTSVVRSTRDLRLSFPDPLTSSLHSSSYEDVSAPEHDTSSAVGVDSNEQPPDAAPVVSDPGSTSTPEVLPPSASGAHRPNVPSGITPDFFIALYGSSPSNKDAIVETLLQKWASAAGLILSCSLLHATSITTRVYIPKDGVEEDHASRRVVSVVDKTNVNINPSEPLLSCPSLAVILLPSISSISVGAHTLYLPVVVPSPLAIVDVFKSTDYLLDAEQQWESLGAPLDRLTSLSDWGTAVVDHEKIEAATPAQVNNAFRPLLKVQKPLAKRTLSTNAILLAILSIVIGYIVKGTVSNGVMPMRTWGLSRMHSVHTNKSVTTTAVMSISTLLSNSIVAVSSSQDLPVVLANSATPVVIATTPPRQVVSSTPPASTSSAAHIVLGDVPVTECTCGCGMVTWSGKMVSTDLIVRPAASASALSLDAIRSKVHSSATRGFTRKGKGKATSFEVADASLYALSTRIAGSISEYFELDLKALLGVSNKELLDALQVLYDAINRHTAVALEQSRTGLTMLTKQVKERLMYRNERAKAKAMLLKEKGKQYISVVREHMKTRAEARWRRRSLRKRARRG